MKVILGGPPQSGKSVLREALKQAIRAIPNAPYPYVITACPDGEGAWYQETVRRDPELAAKLKAEYKSKFTWTFTERVAENVRVCDLPLTLIDLGGIIDEKNESIAHHATHAVLIAALAEDLAHWICFSRRLDLQVVAALRSDYFAAEDHVEGIGRDGALRGSVHRLERGEDASGRPLVRALAGHLVALARGASAGARITDAVGAP
jgi:CRISPR-associated protein Csx3